MDYQLEQLGDARFQALCQALLTKEFPNVVCFPLNQPDGGRDAIQVFSSNSGKKRFGIYQVKFVENPDQIRDPNKWIVKIVAEEAKKVAKLVPEGAEFYRLLTNVRGSASHKRGSMDRVETILSNILKIPSSCWWRNDICRRLDGNYDIKWFYYEVMTGPDFLRLMLERDGTAEAKARSRVIQAFVTAQYEFEREVKFKQVDLQSDILDLFVDLPIIANGNGDDLSLRRRSFQPQRVNRLDHRELSTGAAQSILHGLLSQFSQFSMLLGAPGQGKSTITQFVCQVYRMHLLDLTEDIARLSPEFQPIDRRLPIRVDLRDFATWLSKKDPFSGDSPVLSQMWDPSLESFLAALIQHQSGNMEFTVRDLHAVCEESALLLALDGFDEIAEAERRQEISRAISLGAKRLRATSASINMIVTSRPTAFANSPVSFGKDFDYFHLDSLTTSQISEYSEKWIRTKRLNSKDSGDIRRILKLKLDEPHLKDLSRNPMQLAILLSLIHARGSSLPDKRTALYDSYVDMFFYREAEKSEVIKNNRELILSLHGYLAWKLHSEAEKGGHSGSFTLERLRNVVADYLTADDVDPSITNAIFDGITQRVVFLVSRVQETMEFEVQPLREYFAARHLYELAPYSPPANEKSDSKPDRFNAIAPNFYWLNVTRFYAGFYSKGELASLVDCIAALSERDDYRFISYPQKLAAMLLSDFVFLQDRRAMKTGIDVALANISRRRLQGGSRRSQAGDDVFRLPKGAGREELASVCFTQLLEFPKADYSRELIQVLNANSDREERTRDWIDLAKDVPLARLGEWFRYGYLLGVLGGIENELLEELASPVIDSQTPILFDLLRSEKREIVELNEDRCKRALDQILSGAAPGPWHRRSDSPILRLAQLLDPRFYMYSSHAPELKRDPRQTPESVSGSPRELTGSSTLVKMASFIERNSDISDKQSLWRINFLPWDILVEDCRLNFGDNWACVRLANCASSVKSQDLTFPNAREFFDQDLSLCQRMRYARLRAGNPNWWTRNAERAFSREEKMQLALSFLSWAGQASLEKNIVLVGKLVDSLHMEDWKKVSNALELTMEFQNFMNVSRSPHLTAPQAEDISPRVAAALRTRMSVEVASAIYSAHLREYKGNDPIVLGFCQQTSLYMAMTGAEEWKDALTLTRRCYSLNSIVEIPWQVVSPELRPELSVPLEIAREIAAGSEKGEYPRSLLAIAEPAIQRSVESSVVSVAEIADRNKWRLI